MGVARDQPLKISQPSVHGGGRGCSGSGGGGDSGGGGGVLWKVKKLYPSSPCWFEIGNGGGLSS